MSARKIIRNIIRAEGKRQGVKPSRYLARKFDKIQAEKYGTTVRRINQAKGTHKRNVWRMRIESVV